MEKDIKKLIAYYEAKGWDWTKAVCFLSMRENGLWPPPIKRKNK
mgnify:CR=1 FL=1|jgi:hypothetical protein